MKSITFKKIKIKIYQDAKSFFSIPGTTPLEVPPENVDWESFEIINDKGEICHSTGYCDLGKKEIYLCVTKDCEFIDLLSTVSHEMGHLVEGGFKKNPPTADKYFDMHEKKADHYENFVSDSYELTCRIMDKFVR